jgi:hypothetical protein
MNISGLFANLSCNYFPGWKVSLISSTSVPLGFMLTSMATQPWHLLFTHSFLVGWSDSETNQKTLNRLLNLS